MSVLKAGTNKKVPSIAHEEELSSFTLDEQEVNSMEVEISVGPIHKDVTDGTDEQLDALFTRLQFYEMVMLCW